MYRLTYIVHMLLKKMSEYVVTYFFSTLYPASCKLDVILIVKRFQLFVWVVVVLVKQSY